MRTNTKKPAFLQTAQLLTLMLLIGIAAINARAADGDLDASFDQDGKVTTIGFLSDGGRNVAIQPDGKIIVAGGKKTPTFTLANMAAIRYNADGSIDTTFGTGGTATVTFLVGSDFSSGTAVAVELLADGKILLAGTVAQQGVSNPNFAVARLNSNGSLDTTFGTGGRVITDLTPNQNDVVTSMVLDAARGKFYLAGLSRITPDPATGLQRDGYAVVRYNLDGSLDATFNGTGKQIFPVGDSFAGNVTQLNDLALQPDGKIVATGRAIRNVAQGEYFCTARINLDGTLDSAFGTNGIVLTNFPSSQTNAYSVYAETLLILPSGKIFVAGIGGGFSTYFVAQYNADGTLDSSFGTGGKIRAEGLQIYNSVLQRDGKIVVSGRNNNGNFVVGRLNPNGAVDTTFGTGGVTLTDFGFTGYALGLALQSDGKIVVSGGAVNQQSNTPGNDYILVARYNGTSAPVSNPTQRIADFDGDGKSDVSVFRPSNGTWYLQNSTAGFSGAQFGAATDIIVPADYDGDGKTDLAVFRAGVWYLQRSQAGFTGISFGATDDIPVPGDYDGDGKADIAVFRPSNGTWYLQRSQLGFTGVQFGQAGDKPVAADYDGDGKTDVAVNRSGTWYIQRSQLGFTGISFGTADDKLVPADYDGDGKADVAVFRPSNGTWYLQRSTAGFTGIAFGQNGDLPTPGDYDGDGKADVAVFRHGVWYLNRSTSGFTGVSFGAVTDKPVPNAFIP